MEFIKSKGDENFRDENLVIYCIIEIFSQANNEYAKMPKKVGH